MLMVSNEAQQPYERILVPVDMSDISADAIRVGLSAGLLRKDEQRLLHAFTPMAKSRRASQLQTIDPPRPPDRPASWATW